jgi:hypothetical protein
MTRAFLTSYRYLALDSGMQRSIMTGGKLPREGDRGASSSLLIQHLVRPTSGPGTGHILEASDDPRRASNCLEGWA